jgi:hypothetical protein
MPNSADALRRWLGAFCLAVAAGMLIWGQTVLRPYLKGIVFVIYWFLCFGFTFAAIVFAVLDVRALRRRTRAEHRELVQRAFEDLDQQSKDKSAERDD